MLEDSWWAWPTFICLEFRIRPTQPRMPGAWVFSVLNGVLFQFQLRCLAGVRAVELRAWFSLRGIIKNGDLLVSGFLLHPPGDWARNLLGQRCRGQRYRRKVGQGTVFCRSFVFAKHATSSFPFGPLGQEDSELSNTDQWGLSAQWFAYLIPSLWETRYMEVRNSCSAYKIELTRTASACGLWKRRGNGGCSGSLSAFYWS